MWYLTLTALVLTLVPFRAPEAFADTFSIVSLPDTQNEAQYYPHIFTAQTQWIADNREKENIVFVLHEGDVTNNNNDLEWINADHSMRLLDRVVPYAIALGNHDLGPDGSCQDRQTLLNVYFPVSRFAAWLGGLHQEGRMDNGFFLFSASGVKFLVLALEFGPRDEVLAWANDVVATHADRLVLVVTHAHLGLTGRPQSAWSIKAPSWYGVASCGVNNGADVWDKLLRRHPNIAFVFSGHIHGTSWRVDTGDHGNQVHQILANYQHYPNGGDGWLRLIRFDPQRGEVTVRTYSPYQGRYLTGEDHQFVLRGVNFQTPGRLASAPAR